MNATVRSASARQRTWPPDLGGQDQRSYSADAGREAFIAALGAPVLDEFALYECIEAESAATVQVLLKVPA